MTFHFVERWNSRIAKEDLREIKRKAVYILKNGIRQRLDDIHYKVQYKDISLVIMKLSPLHILAKTVYKQ